MKQDGYELLNLVPGGTGGPTFLGKRHTEESRAKQREGALARTPVVSYSDSAKAFHAARQFPVCCLLCKTEHRNLASLRTHNQHNHNAEMKARHVEATKNNWKNFGKTNT